MFHRNVVIASLLASLCVFYTPCASAQTTQELQQQIQQMKQLYEQQITALEGRIASLEQANRAVAHATQENVVSVKDLQSEEAAGLAIPRYGCGRHLLQLPLKSLNRCESPLSGNSPTSIFSFCAVLLR